MTRKVKVGNLYMGGKSPILIQSMTNTKTEDVESTVSQINELASVGCDIVRVSVYDEACVKAVRDIVDRVNVPIVADVHFDYKLAIGAIENGVNKIRINPGNIGSEENVRKVAECAKLHGVPIRVGSNSGSIEKDIYNKYGNSAKALTLSAMNNVKILEKMGFNDIVISVKASNVKMMIEANRELSKICDYPLHLGVTEAGSENIGTYKSAIGIGSLLLDGIGDTIRVSLTGSPIKEIAVAKNILKSINMYANSPEIVSCPTCGRTSIDLEKIVKEIEKYTENIKKNIKIAIMGCIVNGPGEAKDADIGLAGGNGKCAIFKKGEIFKTVHESDAVNVLKEEIDKFI